MGSKFVSDNKCLECNTNMNVDITAGDYVCPKCGARYDRNEYMTHKMFHASMPVNKNPGKPEKKTGGEVGGMVTNTKKGTCIICKRDDVTIISHEHCSSCWPIGKKFKWNNKKTIAYRKEHPVGQKRGRKPSKTLKGSQIRLPKEKTVIPPSAAVPTEDEFITVEKKIRVKFATAIDIKEIEIVD